MHMPSESQSNFKPAPAGTHRAVCVQVMDLGTKMESYQGGPAKPKRKVRIAWELTDELMDDGRPFVLGKTYTLSSAENASFRKDLEAWRGRKFEASDFGPTGFQPKKLIGAGCLLNVTQEEKGDRTYANIKGIMPLAKGMERPHPAGETLYFSMDEDSWDGGSFARIHEFWQKQVKESPEYKHWMNAGSKPASDLDPPPSNGIDDADIPF